MLTNDEREYQEYKRRTRARRKEYRRGKAVEHSIEECMKKRGAPEPMIERLNEILGIFKRFANPSYDAYFNYSFHELVRELKGFRCGIRACCPLPKTIAIVGRRFERRRLAGHFGSRH